MNPLERFPRLNNAWVDAKSRIKYWQRRRRATATGVGTDVTVEEPRNVLLVVIDSLRADHVGGFGHERDTTPSLDTLNAATFSNGKAPSPWTFPSVPSMISGRYPHEHGGTFDTDPRNLSSEQFPRRPASDVLMLPKLLESAGYDTAMVTAIPMAAKAVGERFQHVRVRYTAASERVETARRWLEGRDQWFLHLHLGDPHAPLKIPEEHRDGFGVPDRSDLEHWLYRNSTDGDDFEEYRDARLRAYDAAVRGADDALGRLLAEISNDTVVVVCGDHGEAFWEHPDLERRVNDDPRGYYATDHGHSVFEEVTRVPLWIRAANIDADHSDAPVSLVDVAPTILDVLDADTQFDGSGRPLAESASDRTNDRALLCEETAYGYNQRAVWHGGQKLVSVPETGERLAFDLDGYVEGEPLDEVPDHLEVVLSSFGPGVEGGERMYVDDDTRDRLAELGYLE